MSFPRVCLPSSSLFQSLRSTHLPSTLTPSLILRRAFHHPKLAPKRPPPGSMVATKVARSNVEWSRKMATVGLGAGLTFLGYNALSGNKQGGSPFGRAECESLATPASASFSDDPAPKSMLSLYELSFGAVCGICTGVFVKKGLKGIAFFLGGIFVLLQYMNSRSFINVNWSKLSSTYDAAFGTKTAEGAAVKPPTVNGIVNWVVDFLTANFQQRASFLAGVGLGLRLG